jgi:hypothetical protein
MVTLTVPAAEITNSEHKLRESLDVKRSVALVIMARTYYNRKVLALRLVDV